MRLFQPTEEKNYTWDIKFVDAINEIWQDIPRAQLVKELKILNILIEHITAISQYTLPEYFSINPTQSLKDIINLIFSKFGNYLTHWEYQINFYNKAFKDGKIAEEDTFTHPQFLAHLAKKTFAIEYSLITLRIYMVLFNNIIKNQSKNNDNFITIPNPLTLKFYDISQLEELVQQEKNVNILISKGTIKTFIKWSPSPATIRHFLSSEEINEKTTTKDIPQESTYLSFGKN